ncbi:MAG: AMIN domain-containing protein [Alphaproteobacteria bacterium]|nr:AMIN domain-containing protein [Alphaproteobacteria bacterium]
MFGIRKIYSQLGLVVLLLGALLGNASAMPVVDSVRIGDYSEKTRFVMEFDKPVKFNVFTLGSPYRVVIELPEVTWKIKPNAVPRGKRITGYRFGLFRPGQSRVVIDLKSPIKVSRSFALPPNSKSGHRLVFDIAEVSPAVFSALQKRRPVTRSPVPPPTPKVAPVVRAPFPPVKKPKQRRKAQRRIIVLDPGHGGIDPGARGRRGTQEKKLVLNQAKELRRQLLATGRYRVVMTRSRDIFVRLRERIAIAQRAGGDLFISLHADSIGNRHVRGGSVYTLSERASDKEAEALARRENKSDIIAGVDLNDQSKTVAKILIDLRQRLTKNDSVAFAKTLVNQLSKKTRMLRRKHRFAGFAVLKGPEIPSVLIEMGYLSNVQDEQLLRRSSHRRKIASAIVRAIDSYFSRQQALRQP